MAYRYLALLRGINVGGNTIIAMADLRKWFESLGFSEIVTYIQSGNVIFSSESEDINSLTGEIEKESEQRTGKLIPAVVVSRDHLKKIITNAPEEFGSDPKTFRYDVMFLKSPATAQEAMRVIPHNVGVDTVYQGNGVVYFTRTIANAGKSYMPKVVSLPIYKHMTIRNWNTTTKLARMMDAL